ncbi:MAG: GNAT family N-acetyltransferase [Eubacterium sp.]|nr:GNAT family N-acetyltransferase [Eubacterium sp.]
MIEKIRLRYLEEKDAEKMYEWMTDLDIVKFFRFDSSNVSVASCKEYIVNVANQKNSYHYAIVNEADEYLGTISLKNVDFNKKEAEYAISTRKCVHGTGIAKEATEIILKKAFLELNLDRVYLNVLTDNLRANAFYRKVGFIFERTEDNALEIRGIKKSLNWYSISRLEKEYE